MSSYKLSIGLFGLIAAILLSSAQPQTAARPSGVEIASVNESVATEQGGNQTPTPVETAAEAIGLVNGQVTNRTAGAKIPPGLEVTLHIVGQQGTQSTQKTTIDANGGFTFNNVPIRAGDSYFASANYQNRQISGDSVTGNLTIKVMTLPLILYEMTTDPQAISLSSMVTSVNVTANGLQIAQLVRLRNKTDRGFPAVTLTLPHGASLIGFADSSQRYIVSPDGVTITDTSPVLPDKEHVIHYIYQLPYQESGTVVEQPVNYGLDGTVQLMVSPASIRASSGGLSSFGTQMINGMSVQLYGGTLTLKAGATLHIELIGALYPSMVNAEAATRIFSDKEILIGVLIGGGIGLVLLGGLLLIRARMQATHTNKALKDEDHPELT